MTTNEELYQEVREMRQDLRDHIEREEPVLNEAQRLLDTHGDSALVQKRITFINSWMEREADYKQLRRAVIEKTAVLALWVVICFVFWSVVGELRDILNGRPH